MAESTAPSSPVEAHEATLSGNESKDGKYGGKTVQEHADVSLKDYDPSDDKFKAKDRVVTESSTGASLVITDVPEDSAAVSLLPAQEEAKGDRSSQNAPSKVTPSETSTNNTPGNDRSTSTGSTSK